MYLSEIKNINDLYKAEVIYDNPYTAICNICLKEKPLIKDYWGPAMLRYIKAKSTCWFYCRACTAFHSEKLSRAHRH